MNAWSYDYLALYLHLVGITRFRTPFVVGGYAALRGEWTDLLALRQKSGLCGS
jgi:hypothetical protein